MSNRKEAGAVGKWIRSILWGLLFCFAGGLYGVSRWYTETFGIEFKEFLLTMASPLKGTGSATVQEVVNACLPPVLTAAAVYLLLAVIASRRRILRRILSGFCALSFLASAVYAVISFRLPPYLALLMQQTTVYEDYYVDPASVAVTPDGDAKNLIYIYLESMETTYASREDGGAQPENNYIPGLTALAEENISFSNTAALGGFESVSGTAWTMGALVGTTSGVPFSIAVFGQNSHNSLGKRAEILPGLTTLGDILEKNGYTQEFLCGSDAKFGGRDAYFESHGNYKIYDLDTARENGDLPSGNYHDGWWGFEDFRLYEIAKRELTALAAGDAPFNFTMLTVDTHHVNGHICSLCDRDYSGRLERVVDCADEQLCAFIDWIRAQDFYDDTVVIVTGDHPRMDTTLTLDVDPGFDRTVYNCFLNVSVPTDGLALKNRVWTSLDVFPTVLGAMGFRIEGNRLGLGTNLFSGERTLAERLGYENLNREFDKYSEFYLRKFL